MVDPIWGWVAQTAAMGHPVVGSYRDQKLAEIVFFRARKKIITRKHCANHVENINRHCIIFKEKKYIEDPTLWSNARSIRSIIVIQSSFYERSTRESFFIKKFCSQGPTLIWRLNSSLRRTTQAIDRNSSFHSERSQLRLRYYHPIVILRAFDPKVFFHQEKLFRVPKWKIFHHEGQQRDAQDFRVGFSSPAELKSVVKRLQQINAKWWWHELALIREIRLKATEKWTGRDLLNFVICHAEKDATTSGFIFEETEFGGCEYFETGTAGGKQKKAQPRFFRIGSTISNVAVADQAKLCAAIRGSPSAWIKDLGISADASFYRVKASSIILS